LELYIIYYLLKMQKETEKKKKKDKNARKKLLCSLLGLNVVCPICLLDGQLVLVDQLFFFAFSFDDDDDDAANALSTLFPLNTATTPSSVKYFIVANMLSLVQ